MLSVGERLYDHGTIIALCKGVLEHGGVMALQVHGRSMHPAIQDGSLVRVGAFDALPGLGTVVLAQIDQVIVLHRVVWRQGSRVLLRGDANLHTDGWFGPSELVAVMVARFDGSRWHTETAFRRFGWWIRAGVRYLLRSFYHRIRV